MRNEKGDHFPWFFRSTLEIGVDLVFLPFVVVVDEDERKEGYGKEYRKKFNSTIKYNLLDVRRVVDLSGCNFSDLLTV